MRQIRPGTGPTRRPLRHARQIAGAAWLGKRTITARSWCSHHVNASSTRADKSCRMRDDRARGSRTTKRAAIVVAAVALICGAAGSLFGAPDSGLAALKRQYWRPAAIPYPKENPHGCAKEELGRTLFFDPILSGARVRSCGTCHNPGLAWGDGESRAIGENEVRLPLRSPTLLNIAWIPKLG